ncbi:glycosyltransferase family 2 protein [Hymenobacter sp. UV11]|uniref:glycosyltransferase family 2 protein n=1 Tax=Hymenobacter sp. UV11 TaxID=1849735 RepID=UPI00105B3559|nr:glycosyltransferase family 2 protein [Hymenobacter sp. UV11]TFZ67414.1 glycosyltransferase family 2 protein [Hymenobacter sp. UV11]
MDKQKIDSQTVPNDGLLGIYVITYNRAENLRQTLNYIDNSRLRDFPITVLNNCSDDNTVAVAESFIGQLPDFKVISNKYNIGLGANFLKTFDLGDYRYTWVLCDDDFISPSDMDDVLQVIQKGEVDLIHVGAHAQKVWPFGGCTLTPKQLLDKGYPYFKFSSFIPCNIFKTESFINYSMAKAYGNIVNAYPHMPFLFNMYEQDVELYICKNPLVIANPSNSGYSLETWYNWWMKTCELLSNKEDVRQAYLDQWQSICESNVEDAFRNFSRAKKEFKNKSYFIQFQEKYFNKQDIKTIAKYDKFLQTRSERIQSIVSNKLNALKKVLIS